MLWLLEGGGAVAARCSPKWAATAANPGELRLGTEFPRPGRGASGAPFAAFCGGWFPDPGASPGAKASAKVGTAWDWDFE